jgi:hypothetical protein
VAAERGLSLRRPPDGVRLRQHGGVAFAFNYGPSEADIGALVPEGASLLIGDRKLAPAGVTAWTTG